MTIGQTPIGSGFGPASTVAEVIAGIGLETLDLAGRASINAPAARVAGSSRAVEILVNSASIMATSTRSTRARSAGAAWGLASRSRPGGAAVGTLGADDRHRVTLIIK